MSMKILKQDAEEIAFDKGIDFNKLKNKTILLTGATGIIGKTILRALILVNNEFQLNIKILAVVRNCTLAQEKLKDIDTEKIEMLEHDVMQKFKVDEPIHYIIHGASITRSLEFVKKPVETIKVAIHGSENILELAKEKKVKGVVYLSSMEVYGKIEKEKNPIIESQYGYIDIGNVRSSYSEGKQMVECMCKSYQEEYNVPVMIVRLAQTFGAGVSYYDERVFAEFARCLVEGKDIVLHTKGGTIRNYCYLSDAVRAIFYVLLKGENGEAYNVANKNNTVSIKEMAELVIRLSDNKICLRFEIEDEKIHGYNPEMVTILDTTKIEKLGWKANVSLEESYRRLIGCWKGIEVC